MTEASGRSFSVCLSAKIKTNSKTRSNLRFGLFCGNVKGEIFCILSLRDCIHTAGKTMTGRRQKSEGFDDIIGSSAE